MRAIKKVCDKCHFYFYGMVGMSVKNGKVQKFRKGKICMIKAIQHLKGVPDECPYYTEQAICQKEKK